MKRMSAADVKRIQSRRSDNQRTKAGSEAARLARIAAAAEPRDEYGFDSSDYAAASRLEQLAAQLERGEAAPVAQAAAAPVARAASAPVAQAAAAPVAQAVAAEVLPRSPEATAELVNSIISRLVKEGSKDENDPLDVVGYLGLGRPYPRFGARDYF